MIKHFLMAALLLAASAGGCSSDDDDNNSGYNGGGTVTNGDVTRGLLAYFTFDDESARNLRDASNSGTIYPGTNFSYTSDTPNRKGRALSLGNKEVWQMAS